MMNDDDLKSVWQSQADMGATYACERLERDSVDFRRKIVLRNVQENVAALLVALIFGFYAWVLPEPLMRIGSGLMVLGSLLVLYHLRRRASIRHLPPEALALPYMRYLREELVRQRDAVRDVWLWHILPVVPGMFVFFWGMAQPDPMDFPWRITSVVIVPCIVVAAMNVKAARALQRQIDQLDQLEEPTGT
ncbi:hypothetical protein [Massilia antarctica]|uniref:hypothetical protein n=1 Tax=Massilia antarctica TaxID=2765360 RepID=UPI0006BB6F3D|nr:hypothetical protein [Massilia sp. H27-R4]MCY0910122.1 hypothetical protein [Massilia sp. H27-R4]CUI02789.1 hypothetical protein BN2497_355 [Janthinobacterium sp. CG23_2]CUU26575.1 hypothetical protein BN3177_355 [Janthinobacterium sp. CG23_2]